MSAADRVWETTTSIGSPFTLAGAVTGYQTFAAEVLSTDDPVRVLIQSRTLNEWETMVATVNGTTLTRVVTLDSSNGGSAVTFTAGTLDVMMVYDAKQAINKGKEAALRSVSGGLG